MEDELIRNLKKPFEKRNDSDLFLIERMVRRVEFFHKYFAEQSDLNFSYYFEHEYATQNTQIVSLDSVGDKFYIILQGQVGIYEKQNAQDAMLSSTKLLEKVKQRFRQAVNNNKFKDYQINKIQSQQSDLVLVRLLLPGQSFGEMSLIHNRPREFTAVALQPCHFACLRRNYFKEVVRIGQEKSSIKEMGFFANLEIFEGWNVNSIYQIYKSLEQRTYRIGEIVYLQGDVATHIFIIKDGSVDLQQSFFDENCESDARAISPYLKQRVKSVTRKIATIPKHQLLGLEDLHSPDQKHRYTCISSSSDTILLLIPSQIYFKKIFTQPTSQIYVEDFVQMQNKYQELRHSQLQIAINSQRQQQQQLISKLNQYQNIDLKQFFEDQKGRFKTLESTKQFHRPHNFSAYEKIPDRSCFTRAKDRSLLGKVQTQSLYQNQAYRQVIQESKIVEKVLPQNLEKNKPQLLHSLSTHIKRRPSPQKQTPLQFSKIQTSLNDDEQQLVQRVLQRGPIRIRHASRVKRVKSTEISTQRRVLKFQDSINSESHLIRQFHK